jgi:hypothetical protein
MTGQEPILALRRAGSKPLFVWLADHPKTIAHELTVRIQPQDVPEQLDLRFLVGVTVLVEGEVPERVERLAAACGRIARRVIATTSRGRDVLRITDTEGAMQWPN